MRRQDIQLLAAARQGSVVARCEVGRRYLIGADGFPRHPGTGIDYLSQAQVRDLPCAVRAIAECLALQDILALHQLDALSRAAQLGCPTAQTKLGACLLTSATRRDEGLQWLRSAARGGESISTAALAAMPEGKGPARSSAAMLDVLCDRLPFNATEVCLHALREAQRIDELEGMLWCLRLASHWQQVRRADIADALIHALALAEQFDKPLEGMSVDLVGTALEHCSARGDPRALHLLGRALCGIPCGRLEPRMLVRTGNLRKGTALLLRAADAGASDAWMHLYRVSADHRSSVANPQMARFFLEKAAAHGDGEAQRKLGAVMLRDANSLAVTEQALHWLQQAGAQGDGLARVLLRSLVLPVQGSDGDAAAALAMIDRSHPWLAARLALARQFGLTRLEALAVDPSRGERPWGLVVGPNTFIRKSRLAAARAIPATSTAARQTLCDAARLFAIPDRDGDQRHRARVLHALLARHGIEESMFFATASSTVLDTLRSGHKWAFRVRDALKTALLEPA